MLNDIHQDVVTDQRNKNIDKKKSMMKMKMVTMLPGAGKKRRGLNWDDYNDSMIYMCKYMYLIIVDMCIICDDQT